MLSVVVVNITVRVKFFQKMETIETNQNAMQDPILGKKKKKVLSFVCNLVNNIEQCTILILSMWTNRCKQTL